MPRKRMTENLRTAKQIARAMRDLANFTTEQRGQIMSTVSGLLKMDDYNSIAEFIQPICYRVELNNHEVMHNLGLCHMLTTPCTECAKLSRSSDDLGPHPMLKTLGISSRED